MRKNLRIFVNATRGDAGDFMYKMIKAGYKVGYDCEFDPDLNLMEYVVYWKENEAE